MTKQNNPELSCSVISADPLTFQADIFALEKAGIDSYHFDVMDGLFVPRLGLYPEYLRMLRSISNLPIEVHLMLHAPELYLEDFTKSEGTRLIPHIETLDHPIRTLMKINDLGAKAGIAINPGTHLSTIEPLIDFVDSIMLMAINPGIVGHKLLENTFIRISQLKSMIGSEKEIKIIVDGGVTFENAKKLIQAGANSIVCGAGTVFKQQDKVFENTLDLRRLVDF
jgi:ribulose-phosphate 3-epimerase